MSGLAGTNYKWRRAVDKYPDINEAIARSKPRDDDDPRLWSEKVAAATDKAVSKVTGKKSSSIKAKNAMTLLSSPDEVYIDDEAIQNAAQDLLNKWISEKCDLENVAEAPENDYFQSLADFGIGDDAIKSVRSNSSGFHSDSHDFETPGLSSNGFHYPSSSSSNLPNGADDYTSFSTSSLGSSKISPFHQSESNEESELTKKLNELEEKYELMTVDSILDGILSKQFDKNKHVMNNLGFKSSKEQGPNPVTKMHLRHQNIIKKKEERLKKAEVEKNNQKVSLETEEAARKLLLEEEREKIARQAEEEKRIRLEMEKIRKEIQEQQNVMREQMERDIKLKEAQREKSKLEQKNREQKEKLEKLKMEKVREDVKRKVALRLEEVKVREMRVNMKCLQKHFHAWYNFVIDQRLQMGKAMALSEWRLVSKYYNLWKNSAIKLLCQKQAQLHEANMKRAIMFEKLASDHSKYRLLRKCVRQWTLFVSLAREEKEIKSEAQIRKNRLEKFLDAAKTGALWTNTENEECEEPDTGKNQQLDTSDRDLSLCGSSKNISALLPSSQNSTMTIATGGVSLESSKVYKMFKSRNMMTSTPKGKRCDKSTNQRESSREKVSDASRQFSPQLWRGMQKNHVTEVTVDQLEQIGLSTKKAISDSARQVQQKLNEKQIAQQKQLEQQDKILKNQQKVIQQLQRRLNGMPDESVASACRVLSPEPTDVSNGAVLKDKDQDLEFSKTSAVKTVNKRHHDPIVAAMEERERIRIEKRAAFEKAKRKKEQEKLRLAQLEQEQLEQQLREEKLKAVEKKRQEIQLQRQMEARKSAMQAEIVAMNKKADDHSRSRIIRFYGLKPWVKMAQNARKNEIKAESFYKSRLCKICFVSWHNEVNESAELKKKMADELYNYFLIRRHFLSWCKYKEILSIQSIRADRHFRSKIKKSFLHKWIQFTDERRTINLMNVEIAEKYNEDRLQKRCFIAWRKLVPMQKAERDRVVRRNELRSLVAQMLPDYKAASSEKSVDIKESVDFEEEMFLTKEASVDEKYSPDVLNAETARFSSDSFEEY